MKQITIQYYKTSIAELILGAFEGQLCLLDFRYRKLRAVVDARVQNGLKAQYSEHGEPIIDQAKQQIDEYLSGARKQFDIPLLTVGTPFQKKVWQALVQVPYGTTLTYRGLARSIGNENAVRAVANANGANAISLMIPCHRIVGSNDGLGGYGGGIPVKRHLLNLESTTLFND